MWINWPLTMPFFQSHSQLQSRWKWLVKHSLSDAQGIHCGSCSKSTRCPDLSLKEKISGKVTQGRFQGPVLHSCVMSEGAKLWWLWQTHQIYSYRQRPSKIRQLSASTSEISGSTYGFRCLLQESGHGDGVHPPWSCCKSTHCFWCLLQRLRSCKVSGASAGGAGDAHIEGLSTASIWSRGLEMEFI